MDKSLQDDPIDISMVNALLEGTLFHKRIRFFACLESTNATAAREAAAGAEEGATYVAGEQTGGRGRGGHLWHSEPGSGIYLSAILRPRLLPGDVLWLSLAAGLAVQNAIDEVTGARPDLRWPNDLLLSAKKCCGILTEMNAEATRTRFVVVGIGVNVNQDRFPPDLAKLATSLLLETGRPWSRESLIGAILQAIHREYRTILTDRASARVSIVERFERNSSYARGKRVHVDEAGGYMGVTEGLDQNGFLRIRTETGLRAVLSGGVREPSD